MKTGTKVHFVLNGHAGEGITLSEASLDGGVIVAITNEGERRPLVWVDADKLTPCEEDDAGDDRDDEAAQ